MKGATALRPLLAGRKAEPAARAGALAGRGGENARDAGRGRTMVLMEITRKLFGRGSDGLVEALYQRICADREGGSALARVDRPPKSWGELAELAVAERTLSRAEACRFLRSVGWPGSSCGSDPAGTPRIAGGQSWREARAPVVAQRVRLRGREERP